MFRNRTNSQKPGDVFYKQFKASYPALRTTSPPESETQPQADDDIVDSNRLFTTNNGQQEVAKDGEPTPRGPPMDSAWNFAGSGLTPSVLDPTSNAFNTFANQLPGYYTPTPGGQNTLYHSHHAGDLHTPGLNFGLGTPLSMPTSEAAMNAGQQTMSMHGFHHHDQHVQQNAPQQHFQNMAPFQMHNHGQHPFGSAQFSSSQTTLHPMNTRVGASPRVNDVNMDMTMQSAPGVMFHTDSFGTNQNETKFPHPLTEKFRYHVTLNAPTAMVKHEDEIPVTYLNKGQAYTLNVTDNAPLQPQVGPLRYRTFVRVSFEDPDQRKRPAACWQLWKEGRGTNEAHLRGGRLQAVEYADPSLAVGAGNDPSRANIELESASFDGFCVTWTPAMHGGPIECPIPVRFNFLSTDFSHSKGVKGIPVRLCAKTELLPDSMSPTSTRLPSHETCYCKVKLFRDHGAERKLSNDIAHVKKSIEKVNQQIAQMEAGMKDLGKRKRSSAGQESQRPGKVAKHRRGWSMSSADAPSGRTSAEDELHMKLLVLQEMFSSTRTSSVLFLRGETGDDPDEYPVRLTGEPADLTKVESGDGSLWEHQSLRSSTMVSPTPSSQSVMSGSRLSGSRLSSSRFSGSRHDSTFQPMAPPSRVSSNDWKQHAQMGGIDLHMASPQQLASPPDQPVRIQAHSSPTSGKMSDWIESLGVDASYRPPPERAVKPVACFYVQPIVSGKKPTDQYYRAIYLMRRTLKDFVTALCLKIDLEPTQVMRTVRVKDGGLEILLDDKDILELPEGQDMKALLIPIDAPAVPTKTMHEWDMDEIQVDGELPSVHDHPSSGYELSLSF